jgi:hypothetical protein
MIAILALDTKHTTTQEKAMRLIDALLQAFLTEKAHGYCA